MKLRRSFFVAAAIAVAVLITACPNPMDREVEIEPPPTVVIPPATLTVTPSVAPTMNDDGDRVIAVVRPALIQFPYAVTVAEDADEEGELAYSFTRQLFPTNAGIWGGYDTVTVDGESTQVRRVRPDTGEEIPLDGLWISTTAPELVSVSFSVGADVDDEVFIIDVTIPPPMRVYVTAPSPANVARDGTATFNSRVEPSGAVQGVTWDLISVNNAAGDSVGFGTWGTTADTANVLSVTNTTLSGAIVRIRATSEFDPGLYGEAIVNVVPATGTTVTPATAVTVGQGGTVNIQDTFTPTVAPATARGAVNWDVSAGNASGSIGSVDGVTTFIASNTTGSATIRATPVGHAQGQFAGTGTINVVPITSITVTPSAATVGQGGTVDFSAVVAAGTAANPPSQVVTWSIYAGDERGSINPSTGVFTASNDATQGTVVVRARAVNDTTVQNSTITVIPINNVGVTANATMVAPGESVNVSRVVTAGDAVSPPSQSVDWTIQNIDGLSPSHSGLTLVVDPYTGNVTVNASGSASGRFRVRAMSANGTVYGQTGIINVISFGVSPSSGFITANVAAGGTVTVPISVDVPGDTGNLVLGNLAITGLPTGVTPTVNFALNAAGTGSGTLTLTGANVPLSYLGSGAAAGGAGNVDQRRINITLNRGGITLNDYFFLDLRRESADVTPPLPIPEIPLLDMNTVIAVSGAAIDGDNISLGAIGPYLGRRDNQPMSLAVATDGTLGIRMEITNAGWQAITINPAGFTFQVGDSLTIIGRLESTGTGGSSEMMINLGGWNTLGGGNAPVEVGDRFTRTTRALTAADVDLINASDPGGGSALQILRPNSPPGGEATAILESVIVTRPPVYSW